jgi:hypothetical protein
MSGPEQYQFYTKALLTLRAIYADLPMTRQLSAEGDQLQKAIVALSMLRESLQRVAFPPNQSGKETE